MIHKILAVCALFVCNQVYAEQATGKARENDLYQHASPYLAMHGRDPVRWREWNAETVALAKRQNKLLFVSSGYFSCHWCHVMQRESYQNSEIAKLLNASFIPVKVDRELNSALDAHLIDFVSRTQGISGWPLNVFVTPEGYPLVGTVYVPPENFKTILEKLIAEWSNNRQSLINVAKAATEELSSTTVSTSPDLPPDFSDRLSKAYINKVSSFSDDMQGGFGQENKFPSVPQLDALLEIFTRQPDEKIKSFLQTTLDHMASQGLRDQLGDGFFRYVVDPGWQIPHFEKMLYDNALLASLYFKAGKTLQKPEYTEVALDTIKFMIHELSTDTGALAASLSAIDDKGTEGGYYLWDKKELMSTLNKDEWQVVEKFWQLDGPPDLEDGHHLVQTMKLEQLSKTLNLTLPVVKERLASARAKMLNARSKRKLPRDDKQLTAWNGLALSAFVTAVRNSDDKNLRQAADKLAGFIQGSFWDGKQLHRAYKGVSLGKANLEDYAYTIQGLYDWWKLTESKQTGILLDTLIKQAWDRFYGNQGWQLAEDMLLHYGQGQGVIADGPLPSPSAVLINITHAFALATGNDALRKKATQALNNSSQEVLDDTFWFASQVKAVVSIQGLAGS